jgi:hypothetical protein
LRDLNCTGLVHTIAGSANEKLAPKFGIGGAEVWNRGAEVWNRGAEVWNRVAQKFGIGAQKFGIGCLIFKNVFANFYLP